MLNYFVVAVAVLANAISADHAADHVGHQHLQATAFLRGDGLDSTVTGNVTFTQQHDGKVLVEGILIGLPHGQYGFHVHEKGDISGGCLSTGPHFNPEKKEHGAPTDGERHVGDLGNVEFDGGRIARVSIVDAQISLVGEHGIVGRALVLHAGTDDLGRGGHPDSRKTGNAGGRVACGVIGILAPVYGWSSTSSSAVATPGSIIIVLFALYLMKQQ